MKFEFKPPYITRNKKIEGQFFDNPTGKYLISFIKWEMSN